MNNSMNNALRYQAGAWDDDNWDGVLVLNNERKGSSPVIIRAAKNADTGSFWQLLYNKTVLYFRTYGEVCDHCRKHGWM